MEKLTEGLYISKIKELENQIKTLKRKLKIAKVGNMERAEESMSEQVAEIIQNIHKKYDKLRDSALIAKTYKDYDTSQKMVKKIAEDWILDLRKLIEKNSDT